MIEITYEKDIYINGRGKILVVNLKANNITLKDLSIGSDIKANGEIVKIHSLECRGFTINDVYQLDNTIGIGIEGFRRIKVGE